MGDLTPKLAIVVVLMLMILALAANGEHDSSKNPLSVIPASEILAKIQKGEPVEYDHVIVGGNLDLSKLDLPKKLVNRTFKGETQKVIASLIRINDSAFNGVVGFDNAIFKEKIDFHGSNFYENVDFHGSNFVKDAKFRGATFHKYADFSGGRFQGIADFTNATFSETKVAGLTGIADDFSTAYLNLNRGGGASFRGATFSKGFLFRFANFSGYVDFSGATFSGYVDSGGATFSEYLDPSGVTFREYVDLLNDAHVADYAAFDGAIFRGDSDFSGAIFGGDSYFSGDDDFSGATFSGKADFSEATFIGGFVLSRANFSGDVDFSGAKFSRYRYPDFSNHDDFSEGPWEVLKASQSCHPPSNSGSFTIIGVTFSGKADFSRATFGGDSDFSRVTFSGDSDFGEAVFRGDSDFDGAIFRGDSDFGGVTFRGKSDFSRATFSGKSDFSRATFNDDALFDEATFSKDAWFERATFGGYLIGWSEIKRAFKCDDASHLKLIQNFKDHGQFDDADDCYYQYREKVSPNFKNDVYGFLWDKLSLIIYGYGVRWTHTIGLALAIMLGFSLWFSRYVGGDLPKALYISIIVLLSLPSDWLGSEKENCSAFISKHMISATLERLIGWGLLIILVNTLSRLMIRY